MKKTLFALLALSIFSCAKENPDTDDHLQSDLSFQSVTMITEGTINGELKAAATVVGPDLCYTFTHFEVSNKEQNKLDIYAKGTVPQPGQVCAQAIYRKDTTVIISKPAPGTYTLNFWNPNNQVFKTVTVTVN
jgi:hypothetical protein